MGRHQLKGLDSLRAIAATVVIVGHIELLKITYGIKSNFNSSFFSETGGHTAVILFFVLSGFLITSILLKEKDESRTVNFKNFYVRRILRVWPLYYIVLISSIAFLNYFPETGTFLLCFTIFPNVAQSLLIGWGASPQIWSIGVEEQFYLGWPVLIKNSGKKILWVLIILFLAFSLLPQIILFLHNQSGQDGANSIFFDRLFYETKFDCMAVGGIFAVIAQKYSTICDFLNRRFFVISSFILSFCLWFTGFTFKYFTDEIYAFLFGLLILNLSYSKIIPARIDIAPMKFLGKISYGLYMYHWIIINLICIYLSNYFKKDTFFTNIVLYALVIGTTVVVSTISYYLIEQRFLKLKDKFK
jgi:peptidoglycan/LPS O-acetylase OafA/YrhL